MSLALLPVRLWWDGQRGEARFHAAHQRLTVRPQIPPLEFWALEFCPGVGCAIIQPLAYPWRDMERAERVAVMVWLQRMARGV